MPGVSYFKPAGVPMRLLQENSLTVEELEAVRLRDIERLEQNDCAKAMNVSRPTFQRVLISARGKIADSLLCGKALRVQGGNYELAAGAPDARENRQVLPVVGGISIEKNKKESQMKIAVISDDGVSVSQHFGRAPWYLVFNVENGKITGTERRPKMGHHDFASQESNSAEGTPHGYDRESQQRHTGMAGAILDCRALIVGGMGMGAYESIRSFNIEVVVTDVRGAEEAVKLYVQGKLPNLMERLH
jgi:predicted DNA-binding protein (UPF0251 family)/predicted Fe-Mo cluster-binding NifX family protein